MKEVILPNGRKTKRLAFGCGGIGGSLGYRDSYRCLAAAYDSGFRHFDVAPYYGLGVAEDILGRFLRDIGGGDVTLTTKAGIARPSRRYQIMSSVHSLARPILELIPSVRQHFGARARQSVARGKFAAVDLEKSLHESLKRLGRDHIDILLMHELRLEDFNDELVTFLEGARQQGKIGTYGLGTHRAQVDCIIAKYPDPMPVVQTSWSLFDAPLSLRADVICNYYGVLRAASAVHEKLQVDLAFREAMQLRFSSNLETSNELREALLLEALAQNKNGFVIISSTKVARISELKSNRLNAFLAPIAR